MTGTLRFVVVGTTFGRTHCEALRRPAPWGRLVGILARGSARSVACAERFGVPLYTEVDQLPGDVDAACVAVRAAVAGGEGTGLAKALIARGIHVLQEHPLHHDEVADCLRLARRHRVLHLVNNHYPHVPAVRRFVRAARRLYRYGPPRYVEAASGIQVAYALVDLLGQALPALRPWAFADPVAWAAELDRLTDTAPPLRGLDGVLGGVPVHLRVHNQLDPDDPDNHAHLLHRISIGTDAGNLTLVNTHGPVVWSRRLHATEPFDDEMMRLPSAEPVGEPVGPPYAEVLQTLWPQAMRHALADFAAAVRAGVDPMGFGQYQLTVCRIWQDVTSRLGHPELIRGTRPPLVPSSELSTMDQLSPAAESP